MKISEAPVQHGFEDAIPSSAERMGHEQAKKAGQIIEERSYFTAAISSVSSLSSEQIADLALMGISFVPIVGGVISTGVSIYETGTGYKITGRELSEVEKAASIVSIMASLVPGGRAATTLTVQATKATAKEMVHETVRPAVSE